MYTHLFLLSQVKINKKERINLQTETNKHYFGHYLLSVSFFPHANVSWPMTNQECHTKIFFFKKKAISHMTFGIWQTSQHHIML